MQRQPRQLQATLALQRLIPANLNTKQDLYHHELLLPNPMEVMDCDKLAAKMYPHPCRFQDNSTYDCLLDSTPFMP